jgi:hypothetical protein
MHPTPQLGFFVVADISGYARFFDRAELDHAQDIVAVLRPC